MEQTWSQEYEETVRRYLPFLADGEPLIPTRSMAEMGLDSLMTVQLLVDIEDTLSVIFPDEALIAETFSTPASLWRELSLLISHNDEEPRCRAPKDPVRAYKGKC